MKDVRAAIVGGPLPPGVERLAPGEKLPSENELRERYGVSRNTVQRAMEDLAAQGLVASAPKRGVFVRAYEREPYPTRLDLANREFGAHLTVTRVAAPIALQAQEPNEPGVFCRRTIGGRISETFWSKSVTDAVPQLASHEPLPHADVVLLAQAGIRVTRGEAQTVARMPTVEESSALDLLPVTPVLEQETVLYAQERILALRVEVWPGDRYRLQYDLTPEYPEA
ncbi:GntR family transcriptional regulator [Nonomuraea sp. NPDC001684]